MRSSKKAPVFWTNNKGETIKFEVDYNMAKGEIILRNELRFVREFELWHADQSVLQLQAF